ncbi:PTS fructose transporter subunit IIA [Craterilacuibacter sp. RT1T]|uniref:PTS sugar transporter subunit IIA n=1 Tax=Craterilacuibacter sp. RT1T TaxID=2942211 RepID=UPI0020BFA70F|nr:PTS fructose transporter subunit IIA [Craterilacuibacter sp. RT1T]MCL6264431.1 PTS fructose transporter subunit IIA [Craterilacuibacter sp. RT1T]
MIGILLITHYTLGDSLLECASHVLGHVPANARALAVACDAEPDAVQLSAQALIASLDSGSGVLVLSDMLGGTPANIAGRLALHGKVAVVSGANLPMLVRALCYADNPLEIVVAKAMSGGEEGVQLMDNGEQDA